MADITIDHLTTNGKMIFLACDQGMEHGPVEFNEQNYDPHYIFKLGIEAKVNAVIFGRGISEKYYGDYRNQIPLITKLNGHTRFNKPDGFGHQNCSVEEAISFGASAVGYTIHLGSAHEPIMMKEFAGIVRDAHAAGIPAIAWVYPRGSEIADPKSAEMTAYAARVALELGADIAKIYNCGDEGAMRWARLGAGKTKVLASGGDPVTSDEFVEECKMIMRAGLEGTAVGRNMWMSSEPLALAERIKDVIYNGNY